MFPVDWHPCWVIKLKGGLAIGMASSRPHTSGRIHHVMSYTQNSNQFTGQITPTDLLGSVSYLRLYVCVRACVV
jgi:hypothetical protein